MIVDSSGNKIDVYLFKYKKKEIEHFPGENILLKMRLIKVV